MLQKDIDSLVIPSSAHHPVDRVMLFEMAIYGHHAVYIRHLVRYWCEQSLPGYFYIVVTPQFVSECADIVAISQQYPQSNISFLPLSAAEEATLTQNPSSFIQRKARAWQEWNLMCSYAKRLQATHCFLASFDFFQWPFLFAQKPPCPISSIYFKPTFHYASFLGYEPTLKSRAQQWQEKILLSAILQKPYLHRLLCLDPFVVEAINRTKVEPKVAVLADPVELHSSQTSLSELRSHLKIEPQRKIFLLFGELTERKGVEQVLEAITLLSVEQCQQLCFLLVGRCEAIVQHRFQSKIAQVCKTRPAQIVKQYGFISQQAVQDYFRLSDVVLAPYQKHIGMSGILLQAAAAQKPVLSSNYGLMGEMVRRYQLGLAVDTTQPSEIAAAITQLLQEPASNFYNVEKTKQLVQQNTVEKFAAAIFGAVRNQ